MEIYVLWQDERLLLSLWVHKGFRLCRQECGTICMQYVWDVQSLTFLAAVDLVVFHHEFFELAQQLHRLLPDKEQTDTQNQHRPYPLPQVQTDSSCLNKSSDNNMELMINDVPLVLISNMTSFLPPEAGWWIHPSPCWSLLLEVQLIGETSRTTR